MKRKRYTEHELEYIRVESEKGTPTETIAKELKVSVSAISHVRSRRKICFVRKPSEVVEGEVWKEIPGVEYLEASSIGRIRRTSTKSLVTGSKTRQGYVVIDTSFEGATKKAYSAHRLVAIAFIPNDNSYPEVNHKNGIKDDNAVSNLEWVTPSENVRHAFNLGLRSAKHGFNNHRTALTEEEVSACVALREQGFSWKSIKVKLGLSAHWKTISILTRTLGKNTERSETIENTGNTGS